MKNFAETRMKAVVQMLAAAAFLVVTAAGLPEAAWAAKKASSPMVKISTSMGDITIQLDQEKAPVTVKNFLSYVKDKHYNGTIFHRVIPNFMIQGGGMDKDMREKPTKAPIQNESSNGLKNDEGTIAMARTGDPNSATAQFFINVKNNDFLNKESSRDGYGYAVFGKVIKGLDIVHKIEQVATGSRAPHENVPVDPVVIKSIKLLR